MVVKVNQTCYDPAMVSLEWAADHVGSKVVYHAMHQDPAKEQGEEGVITSVGNGVVFVRYGADTHSKATLADQLTAVAS